jgi:O-antigen/teichoic acid export membrane protein
LLKHIGSNWALNITGIGVMLVLSPFMEHELGKGAYGVWIAIAAATGILDLLALGVPMASVRFVSEHLAADELDDVNAVVSTGLAICLATGAVVIALGLLFLLGFQEALLTTPKWADLPSATLEQAPLAFVVSVVRIAASFAMRLPIAVFDAHQDFALRNGILIGGILFRLGAMVALLSATASIVVVPAVMGAEIVLVFLCLAAVMRRRYPGIRYDLGTVRRAKVRTIMGFGVFGSLLNFGVLLAYQCDALVIGHYLEPEQITSFDFGNKFFLPLGQFMIGIGTVVMPLAVRLKARGALDELRAVFFKWSKISLSIVGCIGLYLAVLGPEFLGTWIAPAYETESGPITQILMPSFAMYLTVRAVALPVLLGVGRPARAVVGLVVMGAVNLAVSMVLVQTHGIVGVAVATAVPNVAYAAWLLYLTCLELDTRVGAYLRYVVMRPVVGMLPSLAFLLTLKLGVGIEGWGELIAAGVGMVAIYCATWVFFVYRGDAHLDLRAELAARWTAHRDG